MPSPCAVSMSSFRSSTEIFSSCTSDDVRAVLQKSLDEQHQVVDMEFECEQEQRSLWDWLNTPRLFSYVLLGAIVALLSGASIARYILVDKLRRKGAKWVGLLDLLSMDKCVGILFIKTKQASVEVDWTRVEKICLDTERVLSAPWSSF